MFHLYCTSTPPTHTSIHDRWCMFIYYAVHWCQECTHISKLQEKELCKSSVNMHAAVSFRDLGPCADRSAESSKYTHIHSQYMFLGMCALVLLSSGSKSRKVRFYFTLVAEWCLDNPRCLSCYSCLVGPASIALLSPGTLEYLLESLVRGAFDTTHHLQIVPVWFTGHSL